MVLIFKNLYLIILSSEKYKVSFIIFLKHDAPVSLVFTLFLALIASLWSLFALASVFIYLCESRNYRSRGVEPED
jgi:hypothetical protein